MTDGVGQAFDKGLRSNFDKRCIKESKTIIKIYEQDRSQN